MFNIRTSLKNNKMYIKFILILLFLGFLIGLILYSKLDNSNVLNELKNITILLKNNKINFILTHSVTIIVLIATSLVIIGLFLFPVYIIYEGISISYCIISFASIYKFNGILYGFMYSFFTKGIFLVLLAILYKKILKLFKLLLHYFKNKNINEIKNVIISNIKCILIQIFLIFLNDLIIYLFINKVLSWLAFIIN
ncbi:MAG: hypothetical protein E7163_01325 [Firmicutes bacterium]|nr:hypothetical protein [Bacillota bacterium]